MRLLIIGLALLSVAFAQASPDEQINQCMHSCCQQYGGQWDSDVGACYLNETDSNHQALSDCQLNCAYASGAVNSGGSFCCAPALILAAVVGAALKGSLPAKR
jgi:hypothetical protein